MGECSNIQSQWNQMDRFWKHCAIKNEGNTMDPDDATSTQCGACRLPIFSTPIKSFPPNTPDLPFKLITSGSQVILHNDCANLPGELAGHPLHPHHPLILRNPYGNEYKRWGNAKCGRCSVTCGDLMYECPDSQCRFQLDLVCAGLIRILHRLHEHRLVPIRSATTTLGDRSASCDACGVCHGTYSDISYLCTLCGFRLHPDCASLPSAIVLNHPHALRLYYHVATFSQWQRQYKCGICGGYVASMGVYFCGKCRYYVHIKCVVSDPLRVDHIRGRPRLNCSVSHRDAKFADVLHFPLEDEYASVVRYILENTDSSSDEADTGDQIEGKLSLEEIHEHTLIFHEEEDEEGGDQMPSRVCTACVRFISPPYYSCPECPNFFLHDCCTRLPREVKHPLHRDHALHLFARASESEYCRGCDQCFKGFIYSCKTCGFKMDVICTLMPRTITHDSHGKSHILYTNSTGYPCWEPLNCCKKRGDYNYECSSTCSFYLHAKCAALPRTIKHKHDQHPLKLTDTRTLLAATGDLERLFCETCERSITNTHRCYSCDECDQFFHSECIPSANPFVRDGATVRVSCHACPLALVRNYEFVYKCGYCSRDISYKYDEWVYECSDQCYFRIHEKCA